MLAEAILNGENYKGVERAVIGCTMALIYQNAGHHDDVAFVFTHYRIGLGIWMATVGTEEDLPFLCGLIEKFKGLASGVPPQLLQYLLLTAPFGFGKRLKKLLSA